MSSPILKKCFKFVEDYFRHLMTHFLAVLSDTKKRRETVQCFEKLKILHQGRMSESAKENDNEDEPSSATINPAGFTDAGKSLYDYTPLWVVTVTF